MLKCPWCSHNVPLATDATHFLTGEEPQTPNDGDVSICILCGEWGIFDSRTKNGQRKPTQKEFLEIGLDEECRTMRQAWVEMKEMLNDQKTRQ